MLPPSKLDAVLPLRRATALAGTTPRLLAGATHCPLQAGLSTTPVYSKLGAVLPTVQSKLDAVLPPAVRASRAAALVGMVCFNCIDVHHKPPDSGGFQKKSRTCKGRFDPVLRAGGSC